MFNIDIFPMYFLKSISICLYPKHLFCMRLYVGKISRNDALLIYSLVQGQVMVQVYFVIGV